MKEIEMEFETRVRGKTLTVICSITNPVWDSGTSTHTFGAYDPGVELDRVDFESVHVWSQRRNRYVPIQGFLERIVTEKVWNENFFKIESAVLGAGS